jgi:DNA polymerase III subunit delta
MADAVRAEDFVRCLAGGNFDSAILLLGGDIYWRNASRKRWLDNIVPLEIREWAVTCISLKHGSLESVLVRARTLPMLGGRQLIFIEDVESVENRVEKSRDAMLEQLSAYLDAPSPFSALVFEAASLTSAEDYTSHLARERRL